jgi:hypothetical protein
VRPRVTAGRRPAALPRGATRSSPHRRRWLTVAGLVAAVAAADARAVDAQLAVGAPLGELPRFGVNLGHRTTWGAEQLAHNVLRNPGLERAHDGAIVVVGEVRGPTVVDDTAWTARPPGFWAGAAFEVLSGAAAGARGRVVASRRVAADGPEAFDLAPHPDGLRAGDVVALRGDVDAQPAPGWWREGRLTDAGEVRPGSPGRHAVALHAPSRLLQHLDTIGARAGKLLPVDGRWQLSLWLRAVTPQARVRVVFGRQGRAPWLDRRLGPGPAWQEVVLNFDARDDGPDGPLTLAVGAEDGTVMLDDLALSPQGTVPAGGFRAEAVQALQALRPGYLRDWQGQLGDSVDNRLAADGARRPTRYRRGADELLFGYGLNEFLDLCAHVGARPWVVLPAVATPDEARRFGRALRAAWQRHRFAEIVVEHGNEHWNPLFRPAGIADPATLAAVADRAFAALRDGAGADVPLHRVLGARHGDAAGASRLARAAAHADGIAVAPYLLLRHDAGESANAALERALREPVQPLQAVAAAVAPRALDVYEVNLHTTFGDASAAQREAVVTSPEAGAALMRRLLQAALAGARRQAVYTLAGFDTFVADGSRGLVPLFGITRDLAGAGHWRSTGRALLALNAVHGPPAHAVECRGPGCGELTALAFGHGTRWALVNAASRPLRVALPCTGLLQIVGDAGPAAPAACAAGRAVIELPPRAWRTAAP